MSGLQGDKPLALQLTQAALSDLQALASPPAASKGGKSKQKCHASPLSSSSHPLEQARVLKIQALLQGASRSSPRVDCISLAGCDTTFTVRQQSHAQASTSAPAQTRATARSSSRPVRSGRAAARGCAARGKAAPAPDEEEQSQDKQSGEAGRQGSMLQQAQMLLQAYQLSHGSPLLVRYTFL